MRPSFFSQLDLFGRHKLLGYGEDLKSVRQIKANYEKQFGISLFNLGFAVLCIYLFLLVVHKDTRLTYYFLSLLLVPLAYAILQVIVNRSLNRASSTKIIRGIFLQISFSRSGYYFEMFITTEGRKQWLMLPESLYRSIRFDDNSLYEIEIVDGIDHVIRIKQVD